MKNIILVIITFLMIGCSESKEGTIPEIDENIVSTLLTNVCTKVDELYYETQESTSTYLTDIIGLKTYWDVRYHKKEVSNTCDNGIKYYTKINTATNISEILFGGPQSTLVYKMNTLSYPWKANNNLVLQTQLENIIYKNIGNNSGGNVSFNFFITSQLTNEQLNVVINMYSLNQAYDKEKKEVLFDTSTNTKFISTTVDLNNIYSTISDSSNVINTKDGFYRVNITAENARNMILNAGFIDNDISNWSIDFIGIQFELEEEKGNAILEGSFDKFSAYITKEII